MARVEVRRASERAVTTRHGVRSAHSLSFGFHYDAANTSYGVLLAHNDDVLQTGAGYPPHPHRDLEILTWVVRGTLTHRDDAGRVESVRRGALQHVRAGSGMVHAETNEGDEPVHLVQMWLAPAQVGSPPGHSLSAVPLDAGPVVVACGLPAHDHAAPAPEPLGTPACLRVARPGPGEVVELPAAPAVHVFVTAGALDLSLDGAADVALDGAPHVSTGDAVRLSATTARLLATGPAEVLIWEMHPPPR